MHSQSRHRRPGTLLVLAALGVGCSASAARAGQTYAPSDTTMGGQTITLNGHDLTIGQIISVARHGAQVQLSTDARQRQADNYGLLLEATAEGVPIYWFNRGTADNRETVLFSGDAMSAENRSRIRQWQADRFRRGAHAGFGPEVMDEEIVRAMMVVRANAMTYNAPSPQVSQMLLDLLNNRVTPVVQSRGTVGEGDLAQLANVAGTMVGAGEAYYQGARMPAQRALAQAGLKPIEPFAADDNALISGNAYATAQAALAVHDARDALEWADLIYAMDLNGMNSSITPLSTVVQLDRPGRWLNWDAARVLDMIRGSYLFDADPKRIIQDPESLRASSIRQAAAWEEWAALRDAVLFQANTSDHNPAVHVGLGPQDSWELATPQMMKYFVKGGPYSHGQHGYIVSNANWDPYPMANKLENFVIALANMDVAIMLRIERFRSPFFTVISPSDVLPQWVRHDSGYMPADLQQEIQGLTNPVAPSGSALETNVEDLQSQTRLKVQRARQAVSVTTDLLALDLLEAGLWLDVRNKQDPSRSFGSAATAAWLAFRKRVPPEEALANPPTESRQMIAAAFVKATPASTFYRGTNPPGVSQW
ncbi:MAG TPA: aromatic amino acid ammonia-lyase [Steroidobacteraceae bacterium]|nr:aromatic amino acid ammonia-lyase [Steroidobacteraceae bacterium]